ncbi:iron uptake transporter deferrochelatase/peroxidase subunit [Blastococcus sp. KM273129]|uniref:iron uptake transporter deferrochelatase/peroxidase subunit n=1 Tax=Blastococcus sp. KM273129 TaxID=2570315 RepID=UPI00210792A8|nr:iron uptake transporter deferrochelatase/peroxidase subunit [Blastococcus sp. KM273129]MCF6735896.1 deferrochelatase/peroxidase EfeB [Blastococcus sp. KM273129]
MSETPSHSPAHSVAGGSPEHEAVTPSPPHVSRRRLLGLAGLGAAGAVASGAIGGVVGRATASPSTAQATGAPVSDPSAAVDFTGVHQAGIVTPAQDRLHFVAFDVVTDSREALADMLRAWTTAARELTAGRPSGPGDTGEAMGLPASSLTLTIGFGPTLFETADGRDRFGLAAHRPLPLVEMPSFPGDALQPAISGGDLCIQACANDPQVAVHAVRNLVRLGVGVVKVRWTQLGFGRTSSTSAAQETPRNLLGFKDGTANLKAENGRALDRFVWVGEDDADWLLDGSYLVTRRIRMLIEDWDGVATAQQEAVIGRTKEAGAPLGQRREFDPTDFTTQTNGRPAIPHDSHVFLSHPTNAGTAMLRRGYSFVDGTDEDGRLDAGLFFIAYQRNPETGFVQVQRNLAGDALNRFIRHTSTAVFACPPGVVDGNDWWGRGLFEPTR